MQTKKVKFMLEMEIGIDVEPEIVAASIARLLIRYKRLFASTSNLSNAVKVTPLTEDSVIFPIPKKHVLVEKDYTEIEVKGTGKQQ